MGPRVGQNSGFIGHIVGSINSVDTWENSNKGDAWKFGVAG